MSKFSDSLNIQDSQLNLTEVYYGGDFDSSFETDNEVERKRTKQHDLADKVKSSSTEKPSRHFFSEECSREEKRKEKFHFLALDAYSRHKKLINDYFLCYKGATSKLKRDTSQDKTDQDVIRENHKFLWSSEDKVDSWEKQLAKQYYDKLFKEYTICDLSKYKENKVALRWRTEQEVIDGKGQFICGNKQCKKAETLRSWEVNFRYVEQDEEKNVLVKLRICPKCSYKLNYHHQQKEVGKRKNKRSNSTTDDKNKKQCLEVEANHVEENETNKHFSRNTEINQVAGTSNEASEIWKMPLNAEKEKSKEDEFEEYLADMLL
ncbi:protein FRA10AC1 homolog [Tachypleus tridentatus]|uniref:protein FRA10AC1 homolog n=1 Tax=Tachypleus tridentatus TaxID=6853 RepID=UPI003FD18710